MHCNKRSVLRRQSRDTNRNIKWLVSLWRRANARNVRLYYPYWQYTDHFIFQFIYTAYISLSLTLETLACMESCLSALSILIVKNHEPTTNCYNYNHVAMTCPHVSTTILVTPLIQWRLTLDVKCKSSVFQRNYSHALSIL